MQDFSVRRDALFASLDEAAEKELRGTILEQKQNVIFHKSLTKPRKVDRSFAFMQGQESIFKKPELPIGMCLNPRKTPDYQLNPHKWKKYSLADVDISDHTNTSAAFNFLKELDERKDTERPSNPNEEAANKIEFRKSARLKRKHEAIAANEDTDDKNLDSPKFRGSGLVMPEYVVGQKKQKKSKNLNNLTLSKNSSETERVSGPSSFSSLKLSHLQEENDDDE